MCPQRGWQVCVNLTLLIPCQGGWNFAVEFQKLHRGTNCLSIRCRIEYYLVITPCSTGSPGPLCPLNLNELWGDWLGVGGTSGSFSSSWFFSGYQYPLPSRFASAMLNTTWGEIKNQFLKKLENKKAVFHNNFFYWISCHMVHEKQNSYNDTGAY